VAGDQHSRTAVADGWRGKLRKPVEQRVDAGVAGDEHLARHPFGPQVGGGAGCRCEQQLGIGVDRFAIFLFRSGQRGIVGAQAGLDVCDGNAGAEARKRGAKRARRIALDHQQVGRVCKQRRKRRGHRLDVAVRVLLAGAAERDAGKAAEPELGGIEQRMLSGEDQDRREASRGQRAGYRRELDGFRPGADDQPNVSAVQPSP
jgi:hypothetical protein